MNDMRVASYVYQVNGVSNILVMDIQSNVQIL